MKITQIRNATVLLEYGGVRFLLDPMLSSKGSLPPFSSYLRPDDRNPLTDLPVPVETLLQVDGVIVTHLHPDHFDDAAAQLLPHTLPIFAQNGKDAEFLRYCGFREILRLDEAPVFHGVVLHTVPGQYGDWPEEQRERICAVCGVVLQADGEPDFYATGDTVWCSSVERALLNWQPQVILANAGANQSCHCQLNMGTEDVLRLHQTLPEATIVATHMEDLNHWSLSRRELRRFAEGQHFSQKLLIPWNGETVAWTVA